jgi:hypothetical protein
MKFLKQFSQPGKRVLVRVDYNVPVKEGRIQDDRRIRSTIPTIQYLYALGSRVILVSHLGRPDGKYVRELSLKPVAEHLGKLLNTKVDILNLDAYDFIVFFIADNDDTTPWYYWRVRVDSPAGVWSETFQFIKKWATVDNNPLLIAPAEAAPLVFFDKPVFSWSYVMGAARYRFQISSDPVDFTPLVFTIDTVQTSHHLEARYLSAEIAAVAPSPAAETTCRIEPALISPAANTPGTDVSICPLTTMNPPSSSASSPLR